jgi:hypothetical protein
LLWAAFLVIAAVYTGLKTRTYLRPVVDRSYSDDPTNAILFYFGRCHDIVTIFLVVLLVTNNKGEAMEVSLVIRLLIVA